MASSDVFDDCCDSLTHEYILPTLRNVGATRVSDDQADQACTYLCGNSLGALPKRSQKLIEEELQVWGNRAVGGHFTHPYGRKWYDIADHVTPLLAELVGSKEKEVACMGTLTANLHLMMQTFYKPTSRRYKILCEANAFSSDRYAFASQASLNGLDPKTTVIEIYPRSGEYCLREDDILDLISKEGPSIALVMFSGVQFYTGQFFPMETITRRAKEQGCIVGWDIAHAIGNVPLALHDWDVDFAVWCSYKYLNSGPGGIAGLYVHEKWNDGVSPTFAGWWGHDPLTRFFMAPSFSPIPGAQGFQQSNPCVLATVSLLGSLQTFKEAGMMEPLRKRSISLTGDLERRLLRSKYIVSSSDISSFLLSDAAKSGKTRFTIITPSCPDRRGAQLSLLILPLGSDAASRVFEGLLSYGVVGDVRKPDLIRLAPCPLYNAFADCEDAALRLEDVLDTLNKE